MISTYPIHTLTLDEQQTAVARADVPIVHIPAWLARTLPAVAAACTAQGRAPTGPAFARYQWMEGERRAVEAGFPVAEPIADHGDIRASTLPGGPVAAAVVAGPHADMAPVRHALASWIQRHGGEPDGDAWEVYLDDPLEHRDPHTRRTEVVQPYRAASTRTGATVNAMLIDRYLPSFDVTRIEHTVVNADIATTWRALRELDLTTVHTPLLDAAMAVRTLPGRVAAWTGRRRSVPPPPPELRLSGDSPGLEGWLFLGEVPEQEIVLGAVGRFWQSDIAWFDVSEMTPDEFRVFAEPGWGRIAAGFSLRPYGETRTLASYEARTATADPESARRFRRYWTLVHPFVGHIMRAALAAVARDAPRLVPDRARLT